MSACTYADCGRPVVLDHDLCHQHLQKQVREQLDTPRRAARPERPIPYEPRMQPAPPVDLAAEAEEDRLDEIHRLMVGPGVPH